MALIATTDFQINQTLFAYNNNVLIFKSNDSLKVPLFCDMTIGSFTSTIYPNPNNEFYYNFKEVFASIINTNSFQDLTNISFNTGDVTTYVYDEEANTYKVLNVNLQVTYADFSIENLNRQVNILRASLDLETFKRFQITNQLVKNTVLTTYASNGFVGFPRVGYAKYFEGYPFDITFLSDTTASLKNLTNLDTLNLTGLSKVTRLVISDGRLDSTIDTFFLISNGVNVIEFGENEYKLNLEKVEACNDGVYLKWLNPGLGDWSYWLFSNVYQRDLRVRSLGAINNDFNNLAQTTSPKLSLGKESFSQIRCTSDTVEQQESYKIATIFESPKVYLFTGTPFSKNTFQDWIEIEVSNSDITTKQMKGVVNSYDLTLELPSKNTMKL